MKKYHACVTQSHCSSPTFEREYIDFLHIQLHIMVACKKIDSLQRLYIVMRNILCTTYCRLKRFSLFVIRFEIHQHVSQHITTTRTSIHTCDLLLVWLFSGCLSGSLSLSLSLSLSHAQQFHSIYICL
jgi:hypothetical protein